jgi:hypothetical protein
MADNFISDQSKWVKNAIYAEFGKFIYEISLYESGTFGKNIDKLIVTYIEERKSEDLEDSDYINYQIAYNMPCIILVSSPKLWKFIRQNYLEL